MIVGKVERERAARIERDRQFLMTPDEWPRWPVLPLVHRQKDLFDPEAAAFLHCSEPLTVYFGLIWSIPGMMNGEPRPTWAQVLAKHQSRTYETVEQLVAEYRVD